MVRQCRTDDLPHVGIETTNPRNRGLLPPRVARMISRTSGLKRAAVSFEILDLFSRTDDLPHVGIETQWG